MEKEKKVFKGKFAGVWISGNSLIRPQLYEVPYKVNGETRFELLISPNSRIEKEFSVWDSDWFIVSDLTVDIVHLYAFRVRHEKDGDVGEEVPLEEAKMALSAVRTVLFF